MVPSSWLGRNIWLRDGHTVSGCDPRYGEFPTAMSDIYSGPPTANTPSTTRTHLEVPQVFLDESLDGFHNHLIQFPDRRDHSSPNLPGAVAIPLHRLQCIVMVEDGFGDVDRVGSVRQKRVRYAFEGRQLCCKLRCGLRVSIEPSFYELDLVGNM